MNEITELILMVCDRIINIRAGKAQGVNNQNLSLFAHFQVRTQNALTLISTLAELREVLGNNTALAINFTKCTRIDLSCILQISMVDETITFLDAQNRIQDVGTLENGNDVIGLRINLDWVQREILSAFGPGAYSVRVTATDLESARALHSNAEEIAVNQPELATEWVADAMDRNTAEMRTINNQGVNVRLGRSQVEPADDQERLFNLLRERRPNFSDRLVRGPGGQTRRIPGFFGLMNDVIDGPGAGQRQARVAYGGVGEDRRLDFPLVDTYEVLKFGTEAFVISRSPFGQLPNNNRVPIAYYDQILERLPEWNGILRNENDPTNRENANGLLRIPSIELIWSYWMEQGMLVQTMNAIGLRFQNISHHQGNDPLTRLDIDPLRPLNNLLWGYIQDEQHSLSLKRRAYEYDHSYGLTLVGRAVPTFKSVDSRSKFLEAFHNLLHSIAIYYKERDDATRFADAFPLLNALREVHLLLAEGNHNSYGNLTWTARIEMMIQQYLLARPEMREFLGGRTMVPFQEPWMDRVDSMRQLQNWGSTSITYYHDLAELGELIILSIRLTNWEDNTIQPNVAAVWADNFRNEIQRYIHSYRTVTGVDLSADAQLTEASFMQPSVLIQRRLQGEQRGPLRNSRIVGGNQPALR